MSKPKLTRQLSEDAAQAQLNMVRVSPRKLNLVAQMIRGKHVVQAINELSFSKKRIAHEVKKLVMSAIANAETNHQLDIDRLYIDRAVVGKAIVLKRVDFRGRSKTGRITKPFSNMTVVVREYKEEA